MRDFALQCPEGILGYLKRIAANATHDYFKHDHSQSSGPLVGLECRATLWLVALAE